MVSSTSSKHKVQSLVANHDIKMEVIEGSKKTFFNKISLIMPPYLLKDSTNDSDRTFKYWLNKRHSTEKQDLMIYIRSSMICLELTQNNGNKLLVHCKDDVTVELVSENEVKLHSSKKVKFFTCWRNTTHSKQDSKHIESTELRLFFKENSDKKNFEFL